MRVGVAGFFTISSDILILDTLGFGQQCRFASVFICNLFGDVLLVV